MFKCEHSRFCISPDLVCNGQHNCGQDEHGNKDQSDEKQAFCKLFKNNKVINLHKILSKNTLVMITQFLDYLQVSKSLK